MINAALQLLWLSSSHSSSSSSSYYFESENKIFIGVGVLLIILFSSSGLTQDHFAVLFGTIEQKNKLGQWLSLPVESGEDERGDENENKKTLYSHLLRFE